TSTMPRLRIAPLEEAAANSAAMSAERKLARAAAYEQFPTEMGKLLATRPRYGGPFLELFSAVMWEEGPLSRSEREMIATVVSRANLCKY
ncbi:MAG: carboxymuconolactone decarboxylase family protein, partial [Candidatus Binatia bacterium]